MLKERHFCILILILMGRRFRGEAGRDFTPILWQYFYTTVSLNSFNNEESGVVGIITGRLPYGDFCFKVTVNVL